LNFNLPTNLFLHSSFHNLRLVEGLEGEDKMRFLFRANHVNSAKLALSQRTAHFEVFEAPLTRRVLGCTVEKWDQRSMSAELLPSELPRNGGIERKILCSISTNLQASLIVLKFAIVPSDVRESTNSPIFSLLLNWSSRQIIMPG